jgi:hypothetical protein
MKTQSKTPIFQKMPNLLFDILQFIAGVPNEWLSEVSLTDSKSKKPTVELLAHHMKVSK